MKLWGYYAFHTFINSIKKMFRSTFIIVVAIIFAIGLIFGVSVAFIGMALEEGTGSSTEIEYTEDGFYDGDGNFYDNDEAYVDEYGDIIFYEDEMPLTEEEKGQIMLVVEAGIPLLVLVILGFGAYSGMKKGSDIFLMADVNFLFTAPIKPQSVLLFRLTFQMLATFVGSLYILFQIPNLVLNAGVPLSICLIGFLVLIIAFIYQKLVSVGMYTITATHPKVKSFVLPVLIGIFGVLAVITVAAYYSCGQDLWKTLEITWASDWSRLIPIIGWCQALMMYTLEGNIYFAVLYLVLLVLGICGVTYAIWHVKADFYEDAMAGAMQREDMLMAAAENRKPVSVEGDKSKKKEKRKVKEEHLIKGEGAEVFFTKELLCRKRLAQFGFITATMKWYFVIGVLGALFLSTRLSMNDFTGIGFVFMAVLFFRNYGNPIAEETSHNWLYLVPENPYKKVFFAMLAGTYATCLDLLPGMIVAYGILGFKPLEFLLWMAVLVTMDFMLSGVGMVLEVLFPADAMNQVKASLQLMLKFFMILVIVVVVLVGILLNGVLLGLLFLLIMNLIIGAITFILYPSCLHNGIG